MKHKFLTVFLGMAIVSLLIGGYYANARISTPPSTSAGTVTSITAGTGLGGGTITGSGTIVNEGVLSLTAGSNLLITSATGTITVSVTSTPTFTSASIGTLTISSLVEGNLIVGGTATTTIKGDGNVSTFGGGISATTGAFSSTSTISTGNLKLNTSGYGISFPDTSLQLTGYKTLGGTSIVAPSSTVHTSVVIGRPYTTSTAIEAWCQTTGSNVTVNFNNDGVTFATTTATQAGNTSTSLSSIVTNKKNITITVVNTTAYDTTSTLSCATYGTNSRP